jgi:hypothetical protein
MLTHRRKVTLISPSRMTIMPATGPDLAQQYRKKML